MLIGTMPFGFVAGVAAVAAGMSALEGMALSLFSFSGIAQLIAAQLIAANSPVAVTIAAALVVSLRFVMYSAALSPHHPITSITTPTDHPHEPGRKTRV